MRIFSHAYAEGENVAANNGLGASPVIANNTATSSSTQYEIISDPGEEYTVTVTPSASASLSNPPTVPLTQAWADVVVQGELTPVQITVYGSVPVGKERWVLPSQQVHVSISAGDYQLTSHVWSIGEKNPNEDGPDEFAAFATHIWYGGGDPPSSRFVVLSDYYWLNYEPSFFGFVLGIGKLEFYCGVHVIANGQYIGIANADWQGRGDGITPSWDVNCYYLTTYGPPGFQNYVRSGRDESETEDHLVGIEFLAYQVLSEQMRPPYQSLGQSAFAQLVTLNRGSWTANGHFNSLTSQKALDNSWPYECAGTVVWSSNISQGPTGTNDNPKQVVVNYVEYDILDAFAMYLMYKADSPFYGLTTDFACFAKQNWAWSANDLRPNLYVSWPGPNGGTIKSSKVSPCDQITWLETFTNIP